MLDANGLVELMRTFAAGQSSIDQFVGDYLEQWQAYQQTQWDSIARQPTIAEAIRLLDDQLANDQISTKEYRQQIQAQYDLLIDLPIRPGSAAAELLDHVFVEADAYRPEADLEADPAAGHISAEQLRETVLSTLDELDGLEA